jgi:GAF domain-containing protein
MEALVSPINPATDTPDVTQRKLLQSVVEVARSVFGAAASSVFLRDPATGELVFEAVAGEGEGLLPGTRFPGDTGIAGWAVLSGQSMIADDLAGNPLFARDAAESTGYVPHSIMAAPIVAADECVGVLEILDRDSRPRCDLGDMDAAGLLATEVGAALELLTRIRWAEEGVAALQASPGLERLARIAERLPAAPEPVRATVAKLLAMAEDLLADGGTAAA